MSKKVLIVSASQRKNSNSEALALAFAEGAKAAGKLVHIFGKPPPCLAEAALYMDHSLLVRPQPGRTHEKGVDDVPVNGVELRKGREGVQVLHCGLLVRTGIRCGMPGLKVGAPGKNPAKN